MSNDQHISKQDAQKSKMKWEIGDITKANLGQLRLINIHTLPVRYSDKFYDELLDRYDNTYLKFAFVQGFSVGAICARVEKEENLPYKKLYIMTVNVLPAYRRHGIGEYLGTIFA
jgi:ribosomal protein S18 acetylase RimI-like enzyme